MGNSIKTVQFPKKPIFVIWTVVVKEFSAKPFSENWIFIYVTFQPDF